MYVVEKHYLAGIPQTALVGGLPSRGIAAHWSAGAPGRRGALATAQFFVDRSDRNASYHELWWWDPTTGTFGVFLLVPADRAAHSMNPNPPPAGPYAPNAEVRRILGDKVRDPNGAAYAISFAGMPADLEKALADPRFRTYARRRFAELRQQETTLVPRPLFNHGWAQPSTRYDAGERLIPILYGEEADMPTPNMEWVPQLWRVTRDAGADVREQADRSAPVVATVPKGTIVFTVGEDGPGRMRQGVVTLDGVRRLRYYDRDHMTALPPTPRDPALDAGINGVIDLRIAGKPVAFGGSGGISETEVAELVKQARADGITNGREAEATDWTKLVRAEASAETALRKRAGL